MMCIICAARQLLCDALENRTPREYCISFLAIIEFRDTGGFLFQIALFTRKCAICDKENIIYFVYTLDKCAKACIISMV